MKLSIIWVIVATALLSCEPEPYGRNWFDEDNLSISQYMEYHKKEYSKFYSLMSEGKMLNTLYGYNPHGDDYTLFLPTDEAIDHYIAQSETYDNFEELLQDTGFIKNLTRYHTLNGKIHTYEFPYGALTYETLTGERLVATYSSDGDNQIITMNNIAPIIKQNMGMTNGYIDLISEVLKPAEISGYDWLQQQDDYSILAEAMELSGIGNRLSWSKYTILAEHDSIYQKMGINTIDDLIDRIATPGVALSDRNNTFYQFAAYHIFSGAYYLNDFYWGNYDYWTFSQKTIPIDMGLDVYFNLGVDTYGYKLTPSGDTTYIDYISPIWEGCNIMTTTGPVHSISDVLYFKSFPKE